MGGIDGRKLTEDECRALVKCELMRTNAFKHLIDEGMPERGRAGWLAWEIVKT